MKVNVCTFAMIFFVAGCFSTSPAANRSLPDSGAKVLLSKSIPGINPLNYLFNGSRVIVNDEKSFYEVNVDTGEQKILNAGNIGINPNNWRAISFANKGAYFIRFDSQQILLLSVDKPPKLVFTSKEELFNAAPRDDWGLFTLRGEKGIGIFRDGQISFFEGKVSGGIIPSGSNLDVLVQESSGQKIVRFTKDGPKESCNINSIKPNGIRLNAEGTLAAMITGLGNDESKKKISLYDCKTQKIIWEHTLYWEVMHGVVGQENFYGATTISSPSFCGPVVCFNALLDGTCMACKTVSGVVCYSEKEGTELWRYTKTIETENRGYSGLVGPMICDGSRMVTFTKEAGALTQEFPMKVDVIHPITDGPSQALLQGLTRNGALYYTTPNPEPVSVNGRLLFVAKEHLVVIGK
jgi:hypothetical protein